MFGKILDTIIEICPMISVVHQNGAVISFLVTVKVLSNLCGVFCKWLIRPMFPWNV